jgi:hypothetical protein
MARIKEAFVKEVLKQHSLEQISFGRMVELINEEAERRPTADELGIFNRKECPFQYCPHPELCQEKCCNA